MARADGLIIALTLFSLTACDRAQQSTPPARSAAPVPSTAPREAGARLRAPWELAKLERTAVLLSDNSLSMAAYDRGAKSELRGLLNALELQSLVSGIEHFQHAT